MGVTTGRVHQWCIANLLYFTVPFILILILYGAYPMWRVYIGSWYDLLTNSLFYTAVNQNYLNTWNNLWAGGFPLVASPGSDKYYLLSAPFYWLTQTFTVVNFLMLLHVLIAYFGFFKFGSLITKNKNALLIFSIFFAFSGALLTRIYAGHHILLYGLAWLPLLYYFFFKITVFNKFTLRDVICLTIISALIYFTGDIYHFVLAYLVIFVYVIYYAATNRLSRKVVYYLLLSLFLTSLIISIKLIPDTGVSNEILRSNLGGTNLGGDVNPVAGGGPLENGWSSFVFGTGIDSWGYWESSILIGIIPVLLVIIACVYGNSLITVPSFLALITTYIYAGGENTVLNFIHYAPGIANFRCPGRIFGVILPIFLFLSLYGAVIAYNKFKSGESFLLSSTQKKYLVCGLLLLGAVKLFELPYQGLIQPTSAISAIMICEFILLLYFQNGVNNAKYILYFFGAATVINLLFIIVYAVSTDNVFKTGLVLALLVGLFLMIRPARASTYNTVFCGLLITGIFVMVVGNLCVGNVTQFDPKFEDSVAPDIINIIKSNITNTSQIWVYENGFYFYHYDFTYWDIMLGIHPVSTYSGYALKTTPTLTYTVGNTKYYTVDYIVDTEYLENGKQNIPEYSFKVNNISVYTPSPVLPTVFMIRDELVYPLQVNTFAAGEVIATGDLRSGDVVVLKNAYYPGWKVNDADAVSINNMTGIKLVSDANRVRFNFDPINYKIGAVLSMCGLATAFLLYLLSRKECE